MFRLLAAKPVATLKLDLSGSNITTVAWRELVASLSAACTAIEIYNPSGATLLLSTGAAGDEVNNVVPYTILPGGSGILLPQEIARGKRISAKAVDQDATSNWFVMNFFG